MHEQMYEKSNNTGDIHAQETSPTDDQYNNVDLLSDMKRMNPRSNA